MAVMVVIAAATTAIKLGMAGYDLYDSYQKEAAMDVVEKIKGGTAPDYTIKVLNHIKANTKAFMHVVEKDYNRKMMPDWTDANKRAGDSTYALIRNILNDKKVPTYEKMRVYAGIYSRFGNDPKKKKYTNTAKSLWPIYKGFFKTGKMDDPPKDEGGAVQPGAGAKKKVSQQQMLLLGAGVLVVLLILLRKKKDGS